jgi:hypothetical protein
MRISLEFAPDSSPAHRARISYAFRLFCAIYGHAPLLGNEPAGAADVRLRYVARPDSENHERCLELSNLYRPRPIHEPAPSPQGFVRDGEATVLFYPPLPRHEPDWLGEIFEWVSCADEYSVEDRDSVGRVPFHATRAGQDHLHMQVPYAAVAMRLLQRALCRLLPGAPEEPASPVASVRHFVVPSHDVDYLHVGRLSSLYRLIKNSASSLLVSRDLPLGLRQAWLALKTALGGRDPLARILWLAVEEAARGTTASYYFILRRGHRRDPDYAEQALGVGELMEALEALGMEVGVHGSYTSLDIPDGLQSEFERMRRMGFQPQGGRQHWLRFTLERLIPALERAGARYDMSLGWPDRIGFRSGACFAFPPYYFPEERPATFLEIPMLMMDQAFQEGLGVEAAGYDRAAELLSTSRKYGWGGVSLLWHPAAFGGGWLKPEIGEMYWALMGGKCASSDAWLSANSFIQSVRQRYEGVGLLPADKASPTCKDFCRQVGRLELVGA